MGQAGYEYKLFAGCADSVASAQETEAELNRAACAGWRVVAVPVPARGGEAFVLLLERSSDADAQSELLRLQSEAMRLQLEAALKYQDDMATRFHPVLRMGSMWLAAQTARCAREGRGS